LTAAGRAGSLCGFILERLSIPMPDVTLLADSAFAAHAAAAGARARRWHAASPPVFSPVVCTVVSPPQSPPRAVRPVFVRPVASPPVAPPRAVVTGVSGVSGAYPPVAPVAPVTPVTPVVG